MICRASLAVAMGLPSSETPTMPASRIAPISAMASPLLPTLAAPIGHTRTWPWALARSTMNRVIDALSLTGWVLGMQQTAVKPPRAAASVPVSMVSEFSWPGSRRCACMSMKPGATISPQASNTSAPLAREIFPLGAISAMRSPSNRMSRGASVLDAGSRTRPFLIRSMSRFLGFRFAFYFERGMRAFRGAYHQQVENGHAHRHTIGYLFEYGGARPVGHFRGNFDAAIDGAGMQDERVLFGQAHAFGVELVEQNVVVLRERRLVQTLGLHTQDDNHVRVFQRFFDAINAADGRSRRPDLLQFARNPHGGSAEREAAAELSEQMNVGTGHARVGDIAKNGHVQVFQGAFAVADGQRIEQPLRRMLMRAIARIDHGNFQVPRHKVRRA